MEPTVCLILVNYNGTNDSIECVKSLLKINYSNYRIILIDNGSQEKLIYSNDDIFKNEKIEIIELKNNLGFAGGNNYGIEYCQKEYSPDYYLLINNDTVVHEDFLIELVRAAEAHKNAAIVTGKIYLYDKPNEFWYAGGGLDLRTGWTSHYGAKETDNGQYDEIKNVTFASGCLWLLPKSTIKEVGLLSTEYFLYYEDADYCARVLNKKKSIIYTPYSIIYHKVNGSTKKINQAERYYMIRNGLYFTHKYTGNSIYAMGSHYWQFLKDFLKGRMKFSTFIKAYKDYKHNQLGKVDKLL